MAKQFDVFLCHNSEDKDMVERIAWDLKELGIEPWLDKWHLRPGQSWQRLLEQQIQQIKAVAVFVGRQGLGPWQRQELEAFLLEFVERNCPVIPVILPNAPKKPELPVFLRRNTWVDFRKQDPDPMHQLIWGIGRYDVLNRLNRRNRGEYPPDPPSQKTWLFILENTWLFILLRIILWAILGGSYMGGASQTISSIALGAIGGTIDGIITGLSWRQIEPSIPLEQLPLFAFFGAVISAIFWLILRSDRSDFIVGGAIFGMIIGIGVLLWQSSKMRS